MDESTAYVEDARGYVHDESLLTKRELGSSGALALRPLGTAMAHR